MYLSTGYLHNHMNVGTYSTSMLPAFCKTVAYYYIKCIFHPLCLQISRSHIEEKPHHVRCLNKEGLFLKMY